MKNYLVEKHPRYFIHPLMACLFPQLTCRDKNKEVGKKEVPFMELKVFQCIYIRHKYFFLASEFDFCNTSECRRLLFKGKQKLKGNTD